MKYIKTLTVVPTMIVFFAFAHNVHAVEIVPAAHTWIPVESGDGSREYGDYRDNWEYRIFIDAAEAPTSVLYKGAFLTDGMKAFKRTLKKYPTVTAVQFQSGGGGLRAGENIGRLIRKYKLDTVVRSYCASSCTNAFAYGKRRIAIAADEGAKRFMFHGYSCHKFTSVPDCKKNLFSTHKYSRNAHRAAKTDKKFVKHIQSLESDDEYYPGTAKLLEVGYLTDVVQ